MGESCPRLSLNMYLDINSSGILLVLTLLWTFSGAISESTPSLTGALTEADKNTLVKLFQNTNIDNLETAFYVARGLTALGSAPAEVKQCTLDETIIILIIS